MARLDTESQKVLEPKRMDGTQQALKEMGFEVEAVGNAELNFFYKNELVRFFPYSGWHTGKSINDGRGFKKLTQQIKQ